MDVIISFERPIGTMHPRPEELDTFTDISVHYLM